MTPISNNHDGDDASPRKRRRTSQDTRQPRTRTLVLVPVLKRPQRTGDAAETAGETHTPENRLSEAVGLANAIDLDIIDSAIVPMSEPRPSTLLGSGKVDELGGRVRDLDIGLVVVDHALTPVQQRNLEKAWNTKVVDRTGLILEIFGARARTREGVLQVELAHLSYQKGRLVRAWTHLERQRGGGGFLGGPGEAQIELDKRMLQDFNKITGAGVVAMDQVFATLDPTMREVKLPSARRIILSDTVGFISDLPTSLVAAFRATLEEVVEADLILHVRDIAHEETEAQARDVEKVLSELGIDTLPVDGHIQEVWNKIDLLTGDRRAELQHEAQRNERPPVLVSAVTGEGIVPLLDAIDSRLSVADEILDVIIPGSLGALLNWLHETCDVLAREARKDGSIELRLRIPSEKKDRVLGQLRKAGLKV
ncbi:MAG: 50S ribosome-binding GTPase [Hyphomicrobium denitrificans]|nr:50S ribosome-binding GTPase [Hyphomicrobium denitrificans]